MNRITYQGISVKFPALPRVICLGAGRCVAAERLGGINGNHVIVVPVEHYGETVIGKIFAVNIPVWRPWIYDKTKLCQGRAWITMA